MDALDHNGFPEYRTVQESPDCAVGTLPHFLQVVFFHPLGIGSNGSAFYRHAVLFRSQSGINGHLVIGFVPVGHSQIVILRFQVHIGKD